MKKLHILYILIFVIHNLLYSQPISEKGIKFGLNLSNFNKPILTKTENKLGIIIGGFICLKISETVFIQPEIIYTSKGAIEKKLEVGFDLGQTVYADNRMTYNYLELPIILKLQLFKISETKFNILFGSNISYLLNTNWEIESNNKKFNDKFDVNDTTKKYDVGLIIGSDFSFNILNYNLLFEMRYTRGLLKFIDTQNPPDVKHEVFTFLLGLKL